MGGSGSAAANRRQSARLRAPGFTSSRGFGVSEQGRWPVHVYVCVPEVAAESRKDFTRDQVTVAFWGLLHQSREGG